jgi:hypothetical protein
MNRDSIGRAWKLASELESEGLSLIDASAVLAMALGILAEGADGHRELRPLVDGMVKAAQLAFDALRESPRSKEQPTCK